MKTTEASARGACCIQCNASSPRTALLALAVVAVVHQGWPILLRARLFKRSDAVLFSGIVVDPELDEWRPSARNSLFSRVPSRHELRSTPPSDL